MPEQGSLFSKSDETPIVNCVRCGVRCRTVAKRNKDAEIFVKGTAQTGRFCGNCVITDFLVNFDIGPRLETIEPPHWEHLPNKPAWKGFDPECLRMPHIREQMMTLIAAAKKYRGSELTIIDVDWDEVIANWSLPFEKEKSQ